MSMTRHSFEHIPIGTLNIVAFWQTACQNWSVHRGGGTGASRKCSEAVLSSGDEICSMSWKAAQLQGRASVRAQWVPGLFLSSRNFRHCCGQIRDPKLELGVGRRRDKLMRQLSENGAELGLFIGAVILRELLIGNLGRLLCFGECRPTLWWPCVSVSISITDLK